MVHKIKSVPLSPEMAFIMAVVEFERIVSGHKTMYFIFSVHLILHVHQEHGT